MEMIKYVPNSMKKNSAYTQETALFSEAEVEKVVPLPPSPWGDKYNQTPLGPAGCARRVPGAGRAVCEGRVQTREPEGV